MVALEKKFYVRSEIAEILNIEATDKNFARKVKNTLQKWGYSYEYKRKGVTILKTPETIEEKIAEIAQRELGLDVQVDASAFAAFLFLLQFDEDFNYSPWKTRTERMEELGIIISDRTLRAWAKKLLDMNIVIKDEENKELWGTVTVSGEKVQFALEEDDMEAYQKYCEKRKQLVEEEQEKGNDIPWKEIFHQLWSEFHVVYYYCRPFNLNALNNDSIKEMLSLVEDLYVFDNEYFVPNDEVEETHIFN